MTDEEKEWQNIALFAADCEAATLARYQYLKSSSKSELRRHRSICESLKRMIETGTYTESVHPWVRDSYRETVLDRLTKILEHDDTGGDSNAS